MKTIFWLQILTIVFQANCFSQNLDIQTKSFSDEISDGFIVYNITSSEKFILPDLNNNTFQILTTNDKIFSVLYIKDTILKITKIIFDRNLNKDFRDDKAIVFNSDSLIQPFTKENIAQIHLDSLQYMDKWYKFKYTLNKPSFLIFNNKTAENYFIMISNPMYYFGNIIQMGYNVYILRKFSPVPENNNLKLVFTPTSDDTISKADKISKAQMILKIGDTINLKYSTFIIDNFDTKTNKLILLKLQNAKNGYYKNDRLSNVNVIDINNKLYSTGQKTKKYLLLDFWGTWCQPCIANLPKLKYLFDSSKAILQILGIAYEKDKKDLKKFVIKNKIFWPVIFDNQENENNLKHQFNITKFPTYILVGPYHKILFRESGTDGFDLIANYIKNRKKMSML